MSYPPTSSYWPDEGSDAYSFAEEAIAVGGLTSGGAAIKTVEHAEDYGGVAGEPLDPCYHLTCDDMSNPNYEILDEMLQAIYRVTLEMANAAGTASD